MSIRLRIVISLSLPALLFFGVINADSKQLQDRIRMKIERAALDEIERSKTPSLQIAVGKGTQLLFEGAYGLADMENRVSATTTSKYRTASIAKWFTATATMKLAEQGVLELDAPIQKYCPEFPAKDFIITARQLLTHTADIRGYVDYEKALAETKDPIEIEQLTMKMLKDEISFYTRYTDVISPLDTFKNDPLLYTPGTNWEYTSFGYRVLACAVQGAANNDFRQLMEDQIFTPAHMQNTEVDDAWQIIPGRVSGYQIEDGKKLRKANLRDVSENLPAGGYLSTATDLVRFALAFNRSLLPNHLKAQMIVPARSLTLDTSTAKSWRDAIPAADKYGYGIMLFSKYEDGMIGHTGRQDGGASILVLNPATGIAIAVMTYAKGWNGYLDFVMTIKNIIEVSDH